jgi:pimeloyl-ACP methyl ester carboxylesterase
MGSGQRLARQPEHQAELREGAPEWDRRGRKRWPSPLASLGDVTEKATHTLETAEAAIVYDVYGPLPTADGRPPLFMIGQPMDASGFSMLASLFPERTVVTYDPRGLGRSRRKDGRVDNTPELQARDLHDLIGALGAGPVEMFASSGGAVTALALLAAYPGDVTTLVAHEPPLLAVLPDAEAADRAQTAVQEAYEAGGRGAGMATFIGMTMWRGEFTDEYFARPAADPAQFGMTVADDGSRDDPLLSGRSWAITKYRPDFEALTATPTRLVIAVGEESADTVTDRTSRALAKRLGREPAVFPSHHGGFVGGDGGFAGQPEAFARRLRAVLDAS